MSPAFTSPTAFMVFDSSIRPRGDGTAVSEVCVWQGSVEDSNTEVFLAHTGFTTERTGDSWLLNDLSDPRFSTLAVDGPLPEPGTGVKAEYTCVAHLISSLHPTLIATYLDCAPSVFSPSAAPAETELRMVCAVMGIARCLFGAVSSGPLPATRDDVVETLSALVGHMTAHFPFRVHWPVTSRRDIKVEQNLLELNLAYCELTSLLLLNGTLNVLASKRSGKRHVSLTGIDRALSTQTERVCCYVVDALRGERTGSNSSLSQPISAAAYSSILPTIWALLNNARPEYVDDVLRAVIEHAIKVSSTSTIKRYTIDFVGRLLLLEAEAEYRGRFQLNLIPRIHELLKTWIIQLPKTLWELGSQNLCTTETILLLLLRLTQRSSNLISKEVSMTLSARFVPYFVTNHYTRGKLAGPFTKLPSASYIRRLALDVAYSLKASGCSSDDFSHAVEEIVSGTDREYWLSLVSEPLLLNIQ